MATIRKRLLKNGKSAYDIQVKATDKGSGRQYVRTLCWHPDSDMSDKKADKEVILVADRFEKEVIDSVTGASPAVDPTTITFRAFAEKWLEKVRRDDSVSYYATSRKVLDFAYKSIGGYKLRELTPAILQNFFNSIDGRRRTVTVITPKPAFRNILASYGYKYKNLRHEYHIQPATLSRALNGKPVGAKWALELCRAAKIPFDKLFACHTYLRCRVPFTAAEIVMKQLTYSLYNNPLKHSIAVFSTWRIVFSNVRLFV